MNMKKSINIETIKQIKQLMEQCENNSQLVYNSVIDDNDILYMLSWLIGNMSDDVSYIREFKKECNKMFKQKEQNILNKLLNNK